MSGRARLVLTVLVLAFGGLVHAGEWAAFAAPDIPQTRVLFEELKRRAASEMSAHALELRFVDVPGPDDAAFNAALARIVSERPRVVFAANARIALAAKRATTSIPVLFASVADPVRAGLVESLGRPGANLTGFTYDLPVEGKQFELLGELAPRARVIGVLEEGHWLDERVTRAQLAEYEKALGRKIRVFRNAGPALVTPVLSKEAADVQAWFIPISNAAGEHRSELIAALRKAGKPAVFGRTLFVDAGGLASYQEVIRAPMEIWHGMLQAVLSGVPPGTIPVQRPKHFELAINLTEARRIGLRIPPSVIRRADKVVE